jgi:hypothetical protein
MERGMRDAIKFTGPTWSRIWSIGKMPQIIISCLVETKLGITKPGQSHNIKSSSMFNVCIKTKETDN